MRPIFRFLLASTLAMTYLSTSAQFLGPSASSEEIAARTTELGNPAPLPDNDLMLFDELRRVDDEISRYRRSLGNLRDRRSDGPGLEPTRDLLVASLSQARSLDCKKATKTNVEEIRGKLSEGLRQLTDIIFRRDLEVVGANPWEAGMDEVLGPKAKGTCEELKGYFGDSVREQSLLQYLEAARKKLQEFNEANEARTKQIATLVELLQKRRAQVQEKLSARTTQQQISGALWIVISVIGAFSILAILAVKLFSEQLQLEWVASGQVIQFVTVMILLSVIMALGLANILKENTLGTLLGGIAGYVLAQGVGRAAAREVSRGNASRTDH